ncbi:complex 1 protein (LYR family) domain-containing protein [Purpureocillium lavendulum]|uniref:Complex 1 protein (LYR family) domain-containing protein n=1 Tax=Purpureocillium lavendulum TaxID=1247861 RepID=A0AB34FV90_9HYPO|nr:complex 1 protein (LYR family) domain-containing protein [Purpureocillium lavendulum]
MDQSPGDDGVVDNLKVKEGDLPSISKGKEPLHPPGEVASKVLPCGTPTKSHPDGASTQDAASRQTPAGEGGRSVKSIVAWLESSGPSPSPTKSVASPRSVLSAKSPKPGVKASQSVSTISQARSLPHAPTSSIPPGADIEDYELSYLKYKEYFTAKPLGRCLDGVTEDLSKIPLEDIFKNAERAVNSEPTRVRVYAAVDGSKLAEGVSRDFANPPETAAAEQLSHELGATLRGQSQDEDNAAKTTGKVTESATEKGTDRASSSDDILLPADSADTGPEAPATEGDSNTFIQRDPQEVKAFWGNVRSFLHISDDELDSDDDTTKDKKKKKKKHTKQPKPAAPAPAPRFVPPRPLPAPPVPASKPGLTSSPSSKPQQSPVGVDGPSCPPIWPQRRQLHPIFESVAERDDLVGPLRYRYRRRWEDDKDGEDGDVPVPPLSASCKAARKIASAPASLAEAYIRDEIIRDEQNWGWI